MAFRYWLENMGDHTVAGWIVAGAHLVAAAYSWREARRSMARTRERVWWGSIALLLLAIGLNKQLDLQTLAIGELRALFGDASFWSGRRLVAQAVLTAVALAIVGAFVAFGRRAVHLRDGRVTVAAGAAVALSVVVLAHGTAGLINDALVLDLHGVEGDVLQVQVKDVLELLTATVILLSCIAGRSHGTVEATTP